MAKRSIKKFKLLDRHEKLTPEVRNRLEQRKGTLQKELDDVERILKKPTLKKKREELT
jgi:hypothetical protein